LPADRSAKALATASEIVAAACVAAIAVQLIIDWIPDRTLDWSLIGLASTIEAWLLIGFPMLFYRSPALFLPEMGLSTVLYLWILERLTGGSWFFSMALPLSVAAMGSAALTVLLCLRATRRGPNVAAFILIGGSIASLAVECILDLSQRGSLDLSWSLIAAVSALSVAAILLGIQHRLRPAA
jgi:hypothetical protein